MHGRRSRFHAGPTLPILPFAAAAVAGALLVAACGGAAAPTQAPGPSGSASPTPGASAPADGAGFVIHASWTQALPPRAMFGNLPQLVVTADGRVITAGPTIEIYPGPQVAPLVERPISPRGVAALLQAAKDAGILRQDGDFTGAGLPPGAAAGRLRIIVDGVTYDLVGDTNAALPCPPTESCPDAVSGTPAAFATFWYRLLDMASWLQPELGPEKEHLPSAFAVIVGPPPEPWQGATPVVWPVAEPALDAFGRAVRGEPGTRCGIADGDLAAVLRPLFSEASQLTPFVATASASATHGLTVRPLVPGDEDPCANIVE
ncbi:MAG: hypothetical protein MUE92_01735 [Chloroflexi bacterium]|nr:hypothetical protein [Chloroflexota bacterium]